VTLAIDARGLSKAYKVGKTRQQVLKDVDFNAHHGQVTMVMGPSGSGKSTLIAALSGLLRPDEGEVLALGENLWQKNSRNVDGFRLAHCGFIFQGFNLFPALDAVGQVVQVLRYYGVRGREARGAPPPRSSPSASAGCCTRSPRSSPGERSSALPSRVRSRSHQR